MKKGCLFTFIGLVLLCAIGLSMVWLNKEKIVDSLVTRGFDTFEQELNKKLPQGTDKVKLAAFFDTAKAKVSDSFKNGNINEDSFKDFLDSFNSIQKDQKISSEEISEILNKANTTFFNSKLDQLKLDSVKEKINDLRKLEEEKKKISGEQINDLLDSLLELIDSAPSLKGEKQ